MNNTQITQSFIDMALEAGELIMKIYDSGVDVSQKGDGSPVTQADQEAEKLILAHLSRLLPDVPVVAEEEVSAGRIPPIENTYILVDPLDGTREFINRNGEFTVNIALVENGSPVCGVVYAPATSEMFWSDGSNSQRADVENNALQNARTISVRPEPETGLTVLASRSHLSEETRCLIDRLPVDELISAGSSLKFCRVAAGEADFYPRLSPTMQWDTAAGDAVLRGAGGSVVKEDHSDLDYVSPQQPKSEDFKNPFFIAVSNKEILSKIV
ncbi:MAG: 3'(2'),5'-bisphosphate nucleotidase CysQ [Stappiaceae bacterium]